MPEPAVVDTVVLRYFLFVDRQDLLVALLGRPLMVPLVVFDPEEGDVPEGAMSELTRSIHIQARWSADVARLGGIRATAARNADRLRRIREMLMGGDVEPVRLGDEELDLFARLTSRDTARELGLSFALQAGEAACVALAVGRGWVLATDDQDALRALERLDSGHPYERVRRLLQRAAAEGLVTEQEANGIHDEMRLLGFRDSEQPFATGS